MSILEINKHQLYFKQTVISVKTFGMTATPRTITRKNGSNTVFILIPLINTSLLLNYC